jgi:hypothetical protein
MRLPPGRDAGRPRRNRAEDAARSASGVLCAASSGPLVTAAGLGEASILSRLCAIQVAMLLEL